MEECFQLAMDNGTLGLHGAVTEVVVLRGGPDCRISNTIKGSISVFFFRVAFDLETASVFKWVTIVGVISTSLPSDFSNFLSRFRLLASMV